MSDNLDQLLHLAGILGADAAWLPGAEREVLDLAQQEPGPLPWPALLIAHFREADIAVSGLEEIKLPPHGVDREIQLAALLSAALDQLTRIGPHTTARVLDWLFARYGIETPNYSGPWKIRDRRSPPVVKAEPPAPPPPATIETTRLDVPPEPHAGEQIRAERMALGLAQTALAERAGLSQARLSAIERGKTQADEATMERLREAIGQIRKGQGT